MNGRFLLILGGVLVVGALLGRASSQEGEHVSGGKSQGAKTGEDYSPIDPSKMDMEKMMEMYLAVGKLGKFHERLEYFLGKWTTETTMMMPGGPEMPKTKGTAEYTWLLDGRWLTGRASGTMMGRPAEYVSILGYDNHRKQYVSARFSSLDTSLAVSNGAISRDGSQIDLYFQLDEPGTGEIAKNARSTYRIIDDDTFVVDVYDLAMTGMDNKVITFTYTRVK